MNRGSFDSGLAHLCDSLSAPFPKQATAEAWYGHLRDVPGPQWTRIVQSMVRDLDAFPRNLPRAALAYVERKSGHGAELSGIDPDTGSEYTGAESHANLRRVEALKLIVTSADHPARKSLVACGEAGVREGGTAALRKWGKFIEEILDAEVARIDAEGVVAVGALNEEER